MTTTAQPLTRVSGAPPAYERARKDLLVRTGAVIGLWLSLLWVTYLWVVGGGIEDLHSLADGLMSTGRLAGLVASDLLLVQVILMSRLPFLEAAFGQDKLAHQHRLVGFTSFNLMLAHIVLITWGYAAGELGRTPATLWDLTANYPGMLLAVAGTLCLFAVVATCIRAARKRLRYESWHLIHLYAYLGVGLALPHQLWTGQEFLSSDAATFFWWTMWGAAAASVVIWRVAVPVWRSARHQVQVKAIVAEDTDVVSVHLTGRRLEKLRTEPGQFFSFRFLDGAGWTRANPYSLSANPGPNALRITVKDLGDGSGRLRALRPGTRVLIEGPYGRLSPRARTRPKVALFGAGVGITPIRALAEGLDYSPGEAVVLQRYRDTPLFAAEFDALAERRGLEVLRLPGARRTPDSWLGSNGGNASDLGALTYWVPDIAERDVYVCGPQEWVDSIRRVTAAAGLPPEQFHVETFSW